MPDITKIKIGNERERSYKDFPANREFKKRAEDDNPGGGWPSDLPKPSVGGYGYTEQGEQTVITWDGDTEGHYTIIVEDGFNLVHVSDKTPDSVIGGSIIKSNGETFDIRDNRIMMSGEWGYILSEGLVVCIFNDNTALEDLGVIFEQKGIYFAKTEMGYISSLTYGTPDTIHKIDEKYLPEAGGGGAMVVEFVVDGINNTVISSTKTVNEVMTAMMTVPVIGNMSVAINGTVIATVGLGVAWAGMLGAPYFCFYHDAETNKWVQQIAAVDGDWEYAVTI